ncbi:MAG: hypothetical protein HY048_04170 [Acidobacteria bacterium]|nr:hypothetical protein [Acidobacteriota bacterium]
MNDVHDSERALTSALRALARDDERRASPEGLSSVEGRLRAEVRAVGAARRARLRRSIGLAAAVLAAAAVPAWRFAVRGPQTSGPVQPPSTSAAAAAPIASPPRREITTAFLPLAYSDVPVAGAQIVRMSVPRSALASFGLTPAESSSAQEPAPAAVSATVIADVVIGDDGLARAVRFVRAMEPAVPTVPTARMEQTR